MKKFGLFLSDILVFYGSLLLTLLIRYDSRSDFGYHYNIHIVPFGIIFVLWLIIFYIANLYEPRTLRNNLDFYSSLFQSILIAASISVIFFYLIRFFGITPKTNLLIFIIIFTGLETLSRYLWNRLFETKFKKSVLIVGVDQHTQELIEFMRAHPQFGYEIKHIADLEKDDTSQIADFVSRGEVDTVIVTPMAYKYPRIINAFYKSLINKISLYNSVSFYEKLTGRVLLGAINQIWFLENLGEARKKSFEIFKRAADTILAVIFGVISLVFYPFIIIAIRLSSLGPIFYKQKRVGQAGKTFEIIKFRTMVQNAEMTGAVWAIDNDPRVTKIGKFLRKTRLDEIPQLWNIFKGEMSFVGPRAERPEFQDLLQDNVPFYEERYLIKPGLTGWAQINFRYGSSVKDAEEKLKYDLYYIKNRSPILDLGIILKTILIALKHAGR